MSFIKFRFKELGNRKLQAFVTLHNHGDNSVFYADGSSNNFKVSATGSSAFVCLATQVSEADLEDLIANLKEVKKVFFSPTDKEMKFEV